MLLCLAPKLDPLFHLALDDALLEGCEAEPAAREWLRVWEVERPVVVVGRAAKVADEVDLAECRRDKVPVLRRCTGGGAVVLTPGCLVYSAVLSRVARPFLAQPAAAHRWVLDHVRRAISACGFEAAHAGISDLAVGDRKISGNSLKIKRRAVLYHGTILYNAPLRTVGRYLRHPPREPDYRGGRQHGEFIANLPVDRDRLNEQLMVAFGACEPVPWPEREVRQLVRHKYRRPEWSVFVP